MHLSVYGQAVERARETATALGHKLGKFDGREPFNADSNNGRFRCTP